MTIRLSNLKSPAGSKFKKFCVGRGSSSGNGKTSGRGQKGQKARSGGGTRLGFEGGQTTLYRRLPKRGFRNINRVDVTAVNLEIINRVFDSGDTVNAESLKHKGIISKQSKKIKILAQGELDKDKNLLITANYFSASAINKINASGSKLEVV